MANEYLTVKQAQYLLEKWASEYVPNQNGILLNPTLNGSISIGGTPTFDSSATRNAWVSGLGMGNSPVNHTSGTVSIPNQTDTTVANTGALSAGTYLLQVFGQFGQNSTGRRVVFIATSANGTPYDQYYGQVEVQASSSHYTQIGFTYVVTITASTTFYVRLWQNSGTSFNAHGGIRHYLLHY